MSTAPKYVNEAALRIMEVMEVLSGYAITGATNKDLAVFTKLDPPVITRACATLIAKGWARKSEDSGRYYPTHQFTRLSFRVLDDIKRHETRLQDQRQALTGQ